MVVVNSCIQLRVYLLDGYDRPISNAEYRNMLAKRLTIFEGEQPWAEMGRNSFKSSVEGVISCQVSLTFARDYEFSVRCKTRDEQKVGEVLKVKAVPPPCPQMSWLTLSVKG